jgi:hypothetical protein
VTLGPLYLPREASDLERERDALRAEVDRLRAALRSVAERQRAACADFMMRERWYTTLAALSAPLVTGDE